MDEQKLKEAFETALGLDGDNIVDTLEYATLREWDSIAHMKLIAEIEESFDIMIDTEDVIAMSTFKLAKDIVKRYVEENN